MVFGEEEDTAPEDEGGMSLDGSGPGQDCNWLYECRYFGEAYRYFIYDQFGRVVAEYNQGDSLGNTYVYAGNQRIALVWRDEGISNLSYYLSDRLGSTAVLLNGSSVGTGSMQAWYDYYAYGSTCRSWVSIDPEYKFTGQRFIDDNSLNQYYFGARFYEPYLMRFLSVDPAGQFASPYVYAGGRPTIMVDPNGQFFLVPLLVPTLVGAFLGGTTTALAGGEFWEGAALGAVGGLAGGIATGVIGNSVLANAVGNMGNYALTSAISGDPITFGGLATAGAVGAVGGLVPEGTAPGKNLWANAVDEIAANSVRGSIQGAVGAALMGGDVGQGMVRGMWGGALSTTAQIIAFGPQIQGPAQGSPEGVAIGEYLRAEGINSTQMPRFRSGGLWGATANAFNRLFGGAGILGITIERNRLIMTDQEGVFLHETGHFVDQTLRWGPGSLSVRYSLASVFQPSWVKAIEAHTWSVTYRYMPWLQR